MSTIHEQAGRYFDGLLKQLESVRGKPGLQHIVVSHDDWCDLLAGRGPCNCEPEVGPAIPDEFWNRRI